MKLTKYIVLVFEIAWISTVGCTEKDLNTCSFNYWKMDWHSAVRVCERDHKQLLCYRSKKEMDDITETFRLAAYGNAELELWLSSKNCSEPQEMEECLILHIRKSSQKVWHYFQEDCSKQYPFICCVKDSVLPTTQTSTTTTSTTQSTTSTTQTLTPSTTTVSSTPPTPNLSTNPEKRSTVAGNRSGRDCCGALPWEFHRARWSCENSGWSRGGPNLRECRSLNIMNLKEKFNSSSIKDTMYMLEQVFSDREKEIFGEDLADVISMMTSLPDRVHTATRFQSEAARWTATKDLVEKSASLFDRIIELNETWHDIVEKRRPLVGTHLLSTIDGLGLILADAMAEKIDEQSVIGKNMALQVVRSDYGEPVQLPQWDVTAQYSHKGKVMLEKGYDTHLNPEEGNISVVFTLYSDLTSILSPDQMQNGTCSSGSLNSAVMSATVSQNRNPTSISSPVKIFVEHLIPQPNRTSCVFWNMQSNEWDTKGCHLESSNGTYSLCVCDHLTNFAVLMDYQGLLDDVDQRAFHYITVIGCTLSIICLAICVVVFSFYSYYSKHSWGLRYVIHRNLCLTLLVANLILVIGLDKTDYPRWCTVIAGMLHYFFLSAFSWMLLEAVHIYLLLVVVFASRRSHWEKYYLFGYGVPLIIVTITAIIRPTYYGTDEVCWLSTEKGVIWAFMGPVACILMLNFAALILAQWKASNISVKDDNVALFKRWLRVTFILFPVLGITWIFGFLFVGKHFEVAGYLFAFFNSFQGFCIFICHCVMDKKARNLVLSSLKKKSSSVATGSTGTQKKQNSQNGHNKPDTEKKSIPHTFQNACRRNWNKLHKPWSFCFDMPVSERGSQDIRKKHEEIPPKPLIVQWNNLQDKVT